MNEDEIDRILLSARPFSDSALQEVDFTFAKGALLREILSVTHPHPRVGRKRAWLPAPAMRLRIAAVCVTAAIAVAVLSIGLIGSSDHGSAYAAEAIRVAEVNRRLLVTEPGWVVTRADWRAPDYGEVDFSNEAGFAAGHLDMHWFPASEYAMRYRDLSHDFPHRTDGTLLDEPVVTFSSGDEGAETWTLLPPKQGSFVSLSGSVTKGSYSNLIDSLKPTDVDTWLAAMPASVVQPGSRAAVVEQMLKGVPVPVGFDLEKLESSSLPSDRYQLAARVTGTVTCAWLDQWTAAQNGGHPQTAREAVQAMSTAKDWPILKEIAPDGGWDESILEYASLLRTGDVHPEVYDQDMNCSEWR